MQILFISRRFIYNNKKPRDLITGRQGILQLWKLTQNKTVVPVYITGHGIFKVQCTLHNVWGKVALIRLCILILFLNKKTKRLENSQLLPKTWQVKLSHLKIAHTHNIRHFNFFYSATLLPFKNCLSRTSLYLEQFSRSLSIDSSLIFSLSRTNSLVRCEFEIERVHCI